MKRSLLFFLLVFLLFVGCIEYQPRDYLATPTKTPSVTPAPSNESLTPSSKPVFDPCFGDDLNALSIKNTFNTKISPVIEEKIKNYGYCQGGEFFALCKQISGGPEVDLLSAAFNGTDFVFIVSHSFPVLTRVSWAELTVGNPDWSPDKLTLTTDCSSWSKGESCVFHSSAASIFLKKVRDNNPVVFSLSLVLSGRGAKSFDFACR
ncbi:MAG: hypothetical protein ABH803_00125 [Candidatus Micrarchaeota archaeon]